MISFKGKQFPKDIILMAVRWYVAYPLSYRNIEGLCRKVFMTCQKSKGAFAPDTTIIIDFTKKLSLNRKNNN